MEQLKGMQETKLYALELVLLGMVLAQDGDREFILSNIDEESLFSARVRHCIKAVRTKDPEDIATARISFEGMGLKVESSVRDSLITRVSIANARRNLQRALFDLSVSPNASIEDMMEKVHALSATYELVKQKMEDVSNGSSKVC